MHVKSLYLKLLFLARFITATTCYFSLKFFSRLQRNQSLRFPLSVYRKGTTSLVHFRGSIFTFYRVRDRSRRKCMSERVFNRVAF